MEHNDYWKERFAQLEETEHQDAEVVRAEVEQIYWQTQRKIEGEISKWYQRLADNNKISMAEARKMLSKNELKEFKWDVKQYIKHGEENAINQKWIKELENASARFHISRLEALKVQVQHSLEMMFGSQLSRVDEMVKRTYLDSYYHTAYELQKGCGIGWDIAGIDQAQVEKIVRKPWALDGKNFSERIWNSRQKLISEVHKELTQNILLGNSSQEVITNIAKEMKASRYNAGRLIMTEKAFFSSAAQKDCFLDLGVEQYEIVATLDTRTSSLCQDMDGKVFAMKDFQPGVTAPPFHVFCRSTTVPYFEDDFDMPGERAVVDGGGEVYYIPGDMSYSEWKERFVEDNNKIQALQKPKLNDTIKETQILNREEVILRAKEFHREILSGKEIIKSEDPNPIFEYVTRKLGYDKMPKIVNDLKFDTFVQESPVGILYRGVNANTIEEVEQYVNNFKSGKLFTGMKQAYGHGIYFSPKESVAQRYKKENQYGDIIYAALMKNAKVADYKKVLKEYSLTGADVVQFKRKENLQERWEYILASVSEYAALAGYDAIAMNGFNSNDHIIVLNRGKVVIKE